MLQRETVAGMNSPLPADMVCAGLSTADVRDPAASLEPAVAGTISGSGKHCLLAEGRDSQAQWRKKTEINLLDSRTAVQIF
jgi:hypothetical protein